MAQDAAIIIKSDLPFKLNINKKEQFADFKTSIRIDGLNAKQRFNAQVTFKNDSTVNGKLFLINNGFAHFYRIDSHSIAFKRAVPIIGLEDETESISLVKGILSTTTDTINDTIPKDTVAVIPFANYYKLDNYKGRLGCPFPIKDEEMNKVIDLINAEDLEDLKIERAQMAIQEMDSACVLIEQTKTLLQLFEYEETRLDFAKFMYIYTFDIDNYFELYDVFNFENSREELKAYVGTQIDNSTKTKNE